MFAVKHIWGNGTEMLIEASDVKYYPTGDVSPHAQVVATKSNGNAYIAEYGDVFVMQGGKTVQRYPLGPVEDWAKRNVAFETRAAMTQPQDANARPSHPLDADLLKAYKDMPPSDKNISVTYVGGTPMQPADLAQINPEMRSI